MRLVILQLVASWKISICKILFVIFVQHIHHLDLSRRTITDKKILNLDILPTKPVKIAHSLEALEP